MGRLHAGRLTTAHFLKALGHASGPLPADWMTAVRLHRTGFPRRPRIRPGDRLVYYASVWQAIFAVAEVTSAPDDRHGLSERWPWTVEVELLLAIPDLANAPPVQACGVAPRSMSQHSHIRISPEHYRRAVETIASVAL